MIGRVATAAMVGLALSGPVAAAELGEADTPVRVALNGWTSQKLSAHITGQLLEQAGYAVEYVEADPAAQLADMAAGKLNLNPEFWDNNLGSATEKVLDGGGIVRAGLLGIEHREGWVYPPYMTESCPSLPAAKALLDCASLFATPETAPKGRLVTYPVAWGTRSRTLIEAADLPFVPVPAESEAQMIETIEKAQAKGEPILMMFWTPHWIHAEYDLEWVDLPPASDQCSVDPAPGLFSDRTDDCGFEQAQIWKLVDSGFQDRWPAAWEIVRAMTLRNEDQNALILEVEKHGRPVEEVAREWLSDNRSIWTDWVDNARS